MGEIESDYSGSGPMLVMLGDSITNQSRADLHHELGPHYRTKIGAITGEGFSSGPFSTAMEADPGVMLDAASDYANDEPEIVVVALGTNDAWNPELGLDEARKAMTDMIGEFPDSCVVGVEVNEWSNADEYDAGEARAINIQLRELVDVVVPALEPAYVGDDMIHPLPEGQEVFAERVSSGVRECPAT